MRDDGKVKNQNNAQRHYPTIDTNSDPPKFSLDTTFKTRNTHNDSKLQFLLAGHQLLAYVFFIFCYFNFNFNFIFISQIHGTADNIRR